MFKLIVNCFFRHCFGFNIAPAILAAIIGAGATLGGAGISGLGAAKSAEEQRKILEQQQREQERLTGLQMMQQREAQQRGTSLQGLDFLAQMRQASKANRRQSTFRSDFVRALGG